MDVDIRKIEPLVAMIHSKVIAMGQCEWCWYICHGVDIRRAPSLELLEVRYHDAMRYIRENGLVKALTDDSGEVYDDAERSFLREFRHYYRRGGSEHIKKYNIAKYLDDEN